MHKAISAPANSTSIVILLLFMHVARDTFKEFVSRLCKHNFKKRKIKRHFMNKSPTLSWFLFTRLRLYSTLPHFLVVATALGLSSVKKFIGHCTYGLHAFVGTVYRKTGAKIF